MKKENFKSRIGFILVSAGCAIGLGNVWKFPYMCGANGGGIFILFYLLFLLFLGLPILICEFSIGRNTRQSAATSFGLLQKPGNNWHIMKYICMLGNYMLVFFYTTVGSWMLYYAYKSCLGEFVNKKPEQVIGAFNTLLGSPSIVIFWTVLTGCICFAVCKMGLQNGVEAINKKMMMALLAVMVLLAGHSLILEGASTGISFYLIPDFSKIQAVGFSNMLYSALSQAFFTLSIGIGSMHIFGCSINKERSIVGEACYIVALDTFVALMAGFIIIPACFAYGVEPGAGPGLVFITLPNIFAQMPGGQIWCTLFFVFMTFAAASTLIAVYENIIAFGMEVFDWNRSRSTIINAVIVLIFSLPCILGFNEWSWLQPMGKGTCVLDFEDFIVSSNLLPLGSLIYLLFCTRSNGWDWDGFATEANTGIGAKLPNCIRWYMSNVIPMIIVIIYLKGYYDLFASKSATTFYSMMAFACFMLGIVFYAAYPRSKK